MARASKSRTPCSAAVADAISGAQSVLQELKDEFQEILDSVDGTGLAESSVNQTRQETVDALEYFVDDYVDLPEGHEDIEVKWVEDLGSYQSRRVRCGNAAAALNASAEALEAWADELESQSSEKQSEIDEGSDEDADDEELENEISALDDKAQEARQAAETVRVWADSADNCEWPGMYG